MTTKIDDQPDLPTVAELYLARRITEVLQKHYRGHLWGVNVRRSVATIHNFSLSGNYGYVLHVEKIKGEDDLKRGVVRAGGEILERYRLERGMVNGDQLRGLKRDFAGRPIFDGR